MALPKLTFWRVVLIALAIVVAVNVLLLLPFDRALTVESRHFAHILRSPEAAAMIRSLFVSMQDLNKGARRPANVPPVKIKKVGIIGTRTVMESKLYGKITQAEVIAPEGDEFERVQQCYGDMASIGRVTDEQRQTFFEAGRRLADRGAEAVLLGGTDLFLAFTGRDCGFPVIDCADVHIDAIYRKSSA